RAVYHIDARARRISPPRPGCYTPVTWLNSSRTPPNGEDSARGLLALAPEVPRQQDAPLVFGKVRDDGVLGLPGPLEARPGVSHQDDVGHGPATLFFARADLQFCWHEAEALVIVAGAGRELVLGPEAAHFGVQSRVGPRPVLLNQGLEIVQDGGSRASVHGRRRRRPAAGQCHHPGEAGSTAELHRTLRVSS